MPFHEEVKDSITALGVIEAWVVLQGEEAQNCFTDVCFGELSASCSCLLGSGQRAAMCP
jgi:hypothetical protein